MYQIYFILEWHSTCFGRSFRPSSGVQDCTYSNRHLSNRYCCLLAVSVWQMPVCTVMNSWWWTERTSETCRMSFQYKINLIHWCILAPFGTIVTWSENLNFLEPSGHLGPVMGLIYLYLLYIGASCWFYYRNNILLLNTNVTFDIVGVLILFLFFSFFANWPHKCLFETQNPPTSFLLSLCLQQTVFTCSVWHHFSISSHKNTSANLLRVN